MTPSPRAQAVLAAARRGEYAAAFRALLPAHRVRWPRLDSFYDFTGDQDLLAENPRHPRLGAAELKTVLRALDALPAAAARELLSSYAFLCASRYLPAARRAASAHRQGERAQGALLEACALWLQCDAKRSRRWLAPALERAEEAVAALPRRPALLLRCQIFFELERHGEGLADLARILRQDPGDAAARVGRADGLADLGRYPAALRELGRLHRKGPVPWWLFAQRGRLLGLCGRLGAALRELDAALRRRPRHGALLAWRAEVLRKLGRLAGSRRDLDRALALEPDNAFARECRGRLLLTLGQTRAALEDLGRACRLDPARCLAFAWRGEARLRLGLLRGAWRDFERVYPLEPMNFWNSDRAAEGRLPGPQERRDCYRRALDAAVRRVPRDGVAWLLRGRDRAATGQERRALSDLSRAHGLLKEEPAGLRAAALAWRGRAWLRLGRRGRAAADLRTACALQPGAARWSAWLSEALAA